MNSSSIENSKNTLQASLKKEIVDSKPNSPNKMSTFRGNLSIKPAQSFGLRRKHKTNSSSVLKMRSMGPKTLF